MKRIAFIAGFLVSAAAAWADTVHVELTGQIGGGCSAVAVSGDLAYLGIGQHLVILDVSEQSNPILLAQSEVLSDGIVDVALSGDYAYVAALSAGLQVINGSDPHALTVANCSFTGNSAGWSGGEIGNYDDGHESFSDLPTALDLRRRPPHFPAVAGNRVRWEFGEPSLWGSTAVFPPAAEASTAVRPVEGLR